MSHRLLGKKVGMMQIFDKEGKAVPCTVIEMQPNIVTQIKTKEKDGYNAIQIGSDEIKTKDSRTLEKRLSKPLRGHFQKNGIAPLRHLMEIRIDNPGDYSVGQALSVELFNEDAFVDVTAISKGKGFQGVMKLHNFSGGPGSHGSGFHRHAGSTGMRSTPGRCLPGGKRASHMGAKRVTVQNLPVLKIQDNCILVKGAIPGARTGLVEVKTAVKITGKKAKK